MPRLSLRNDLDTFKREYHMNFTDDDEGFARASTLFPESEEAGKIRAVDNIAQQERMCSEQGNKLIVDIVVSHGHFVDQTRILIAQVESFDNWSFYCATTAYRLEIEAATGSISR